MGIDQSSQQNALDEILRYPVAEFIPSPSHLKNIEPLIIQQIQDFNKLIGEDISKVEDTSEHSNQSDEPAEFLIFEDDVSKTPTCADEEYENDHFVSRRRSSLFLLHLYVSFF